jgi:glycosyltransferase involved in cell wall biosynthesis
VEEDDIGGEVKVLHVCWDLGQGGIQRYLVDLLRAHYNTVRSTVLVLSSPGELSDEAARYSDQIIYLGMKGGTSLTSVLPMLRTLRSGTHDVVHSHSNNVLFNLALRFQSKPVLYTEHGGRLLNEERASLWMYRYLSNQIDRYIAISHFIADFMSSSYPHIADRISVIHNGICIEDGAPGEGLQGAMQELPDGPKVAFVGRLVIDKGIDLFVKTALKVHRINPEVNFIVIGDGPERENMENIVREQQLEHRFHFLGFRHDVRKIFNSLDLFLFTSRYDAFGLVIVESLAAGVPVVAMVENSAAPEVLREGVDGLLVNGLDVDAAAECVVTLLGDEKLWAEMSAAAKRRASEFTIERNAAAVASEYRKCLESNDTT